MIKKIGRDKWRHFFVGIILGAGLQGLLWYLLPTHPVLSIVGTFLIVFALSYGFELFSLFTGLGYYEFLDAVAGTIGGVVGMVVVLVFIFV